ncbi:hypothetical protein LEN26_013264 [Aphanomyces euteiches]|nr:hypothetical protein LEN26_013264 [Aphanomyces euteiches]
MYVSLSEASLSNVIFNSSVALSNGGAIAVKSAATVLNLFNISILNSGAEKGGGIFMIDYVTPKGSMQNLSFINTTASVMGGAVYGVLSKVDFNGLEAYNVSSKNGGTIALDSSSGNITNANISKSSATINGGALYLIVTTLKCSSLRLAQNYATNYGGGIYAFASTVDIVALEMSSSQASVGGGLYASSSVLSLSLSTIRSNHAINGGGISSDLSDIYIDSSLFDGNYAASMGAAGYISYNYLQLTYSTFLNGLAKQGGAFTLNNIQKFAIDGCNFTQNTVSQNDLNSATQQGGAIVVTQISKNSTISNSNFSQNAAGTTNGGAIYATMSGMAPTVELLFENTSFASNFGGIGGAVYFDSFLTRLRNVVFKSNKATTGGGGGVFWTGVEPIGLQNQLYGNNTALYGPDFASVPYALLPTYTPPQGLSGEASGQVFVGSFLVYIVDQYNQTVKTENSIVVALVTPTSGATLVGTPLATAIAGVCDFSSVGVQQTPGKNVTIFVSSPPLIALDQVIIPVRTCVVGEIIPMGVSQCVECAFGKFSWNTSDTVCHDCPEGAICRGGKAMDALSGYWRIENTTGVCTDSSNPYDSCKFNTCLGTSCNGYSLSSDGVNILLGGPNSTIILTLSEGDTASYNPSDILSVAGETVEVVSFANGQVFVKTSADLPTEGNVAIYRPGQETCSVGYKGNLCLQCAKGYTRSGKSSCVACPTNYTLTVLALVGGILGVIVIVVILIRMAINKARKRKSITSTLSKIFTSFLQLIILAESFNVNWPSEVTAMFEAQGYYKDNVSSMSDFYSMLILYLCLPVAAVIFPCIYWLIYFMSIRRRHQHKDWTSIYTDHALVGEKELDGLFKSLGEKPSEMVLLAIKTDLKDSSLSIEKVKTAYLNAIKSEAYCKLILSIIVILFLIHPSLTEKLFEMFACTQLGSDAHGNALYFLNPDLDVQCYTDSHYRWMYYVGVPGLLGFTFGVPVLALFILFSRRHRLELMTTKLEFGFMYMGFKPKYYYWEIWVMMRKNTVSFISVFLKPSGTGPQALAATVLVFVAYHLHMDRNPYEDERVNRLEEFSLLTSLLTLFCALFLYQVEVVGTWRGVFGVLVIIGNCLFIVDFTRLMFTELKDKAKRTIQSIDTPVRVKKALKKVQPMFKRHKQAAGPNRQKVFIELKSHQ